MRAVFCGTAAGTVSAQRGAYYAGPGNRFWPVLAAIGLTPHRLRPEQFRHLLDFGIGLTDMVKTAFGADTDLPARAFDRPRFETAIRASRPGFVAFNGKRAASAFFGVATARLAYGPATGPEEFPPIWVLPSTSGAASGAWDETWWRRFADAVRSA